MIVSVASGLVISATYPTSAARACSGVFRSGDPPYSGPIWPDLARFTRSREAEMRRGAAWFRSLVAWSGVRRSGKIFKSLSFPLISYHFYRKAETRGEPSSSPSPRGRRDLPSKPGMRGSRLRGNDACDQCTGGRGGGAMGVCRWLGGAPPNRDARFPPARERRIYGAPIFERVHSIDACGGLCYDSPCLVVGAERNHPFPSRTRK